MSEIRRLQKAIHDLHGVESTHLRSESVHETFQDAMRASIAAAAHPRKPA